MNVIDKFAPDCYDWDVPFLEKIKEGLTECIVFGVCANTINDDNQLNTIIIITPDKQWFMIVIDPLSGIDIYKINEFMDIFDDDIDWPSKEVEGFDETGVLVDVEPIRKAMTDLIEESKQ